MHLGKADLAAGLERGREVLVRLAREANDEVAREREVRHGLAGAINDRAVLGDGVGPAHAAQRFVAARLERHVEELRHTPVARRHDAEELIRDARRLHGREAHAPHLGLVEHAVKKPCEVKPLTLISPEVNTGEHHLARTLGDERAHLAHDVGGIERARAAARLPDDAVGAAVVAAVLDLEARAHAARGRDGVAGSHALANVERGERAGGDATRGGRRRRVARGITLVHSPALASVGPGADTRPRREM